MKSFRCIVFWLVGFLFMSFNCFSNGVNRSGMIINDDKTMSKFRRLKENNYGPKLDQGCCNGFVSIEDYSTVDPSPGSKASVEHGPIEHGTPMIPYFPKPPPPSPSPSNYDGSP